MKKLLFLFIAMILLINTSWAQLSGQKYIPGSAGPNDYATIALAIADLNLNGVGAGGVIFNIAAGYTETITGPLTVTATGTAANPIAFQKNGVGANPLITAYVGTMTPGSLTSIDGIWCLVGSDYVTIDGIDLTDPNTTNPASMEYGYGLFKASATDGCKYNTIKNCTISLQNVNDVSGVGAVYQGSVGIALYNRKADSTYNLTITAASGTSSYNKFYTNTIQGSYGGIAFIGYAGPNPFTLCDRGNDIGGNATEFGNTIKNYGSTGTANAIAGVFLKDQWDFNVSFNTIINNDGAGVNAVTTLRGIFANVSSTSASGNINNNTITLKFGGTTSQVSCIEQSAGSTAFGNTINIKNNIITNCENNSATSSVWYGIYNTASCANLKINGNTFNNNTSKATSGATYLIYNTGAVAITDSICNNLLTFNHINTAAYTGALYSLYNAGAATSCKVYLKNNDFSNYNHTTLGTGSMYYLYSTGSPLSLYISNNTWSNLTINNSGLNYLNYVTSAVQGGEFNFTNNTINGSYIRLGASGAFYCYYHSAASLPSTTHIVSDNDFSNITSTVTGSGAFYGIYDIDGTSSPYQKKMIFNNVISNINYYTSSTSVYGMFVNYLGDGGTTSGSQVYNNNITAITIPTIAGGTMYGLYISTTISPNYRPQVYSNNITNLTTGNPGTTPTAYGVYAGGGGAGIDFYNNNINAITSNGTTTGSAFGLTIASSGINANFYNNYISDIKAPSNTNTTDGVRGINITSTSSLSNINLYYNTVFLAASSIGVNFHSSAIYHTYSATATTAALTMKNNIFVNMSTPAGAGISAVFKRSAATNIVNLTMFSNNNCFYSPTAIYFDGTNTDASFAAFQTRMLGRELQSFSEMPPFINSAAAPYDLHLSNLMATQCESGGQPIASVTTDPDNDIRNATKPDVGADEGAFIASDLIPPMIVYNLLPTVGSTNNTLIATITDPSGVPTSGPGLPVLYYKITRAGSTLSYYASSLGNNQYSFDFGSGAITGDTIFYYVVARDNSTALNTGCNPAPGAGGFTPNPPAAATPPTAFTALSGFSNYIVVSGSMSGIYTIDNTQVTGGTNFASFTDAVTTLNNSLITGPVTFNVSAGQSWTKIITPAGTSAYKITNTGSEAYPVIFQKSGTGANPLVKVFGTSTTNEAAFWLNGSDYFTFNGIDIADSTNLLDLGFYYYGTATDGCHYNTVKNCNITLSNTSANTNPTGVYLISQAAQMSGTNSHNKFYNNKISNVFYGYKFTGINVGFLDVKNEIGTENNGRSIIQSVGYNGSATVQGINIQFQDSLQLFNTLIDTIRTTGSSCIGIVFNNSCSNFNIYNDTIRQINSGEPYGMNVASGTHFGTNYIHDCLLTEFTAISGNMNVFRNEGSPMGTIYIYNNTVSNMTHSTAGTAIEGFYINSLSTIYMYNNKLFNFNHTGTGSCVVEPMAIQNAGNTTTAYNNFIYDIKAPNSTAVPAVRGLRVQAGNVKLYYNTIYLDYISLNAANTSAGIHVSAAPILLDMRNNIVVNNTDMTTGTRAAAFWYYVNYYDFIAATTNNNLYYCGTPSSKNLIFYDGTNSAQAMADYKTLIATKDQGSFTGNPPFISSVFPYDVHINTTVPNITEGTGQAIPGFNTDIDGNIRFGSPGYTGGSITGSDLGADEYSGLPAIICSGTPPATSIVGAASVCTNNGTSLTLSVPNTDLGITHQWAYSTISGGPYTTMGVNAGQATGNLVSSTFFIDTIRCTNSNLYYVTPEKLVTVYPYPIVVVTPPSGSYCVTGSVGLKATGATTYSWAPALGLDITTGDTVNASPSMTTLYTVTGTSDGCSTNTAVTISVNPNPTTVTITPTSASVCNGSIQTLVATGGTIGGSGTIGTGVVSNTTQTPYKGFWGGHKQQMLFTASELTAMGLSAGTPITEISFDITVFTSPYTFNGFTIAMKNTASTVLTTTLETGVTTVVAPTNYVLSGTAPFTVSHTLNTPFNWNGTSSLLIETCFNNNNGGGVSANSANVKSTTTATALCNYYTADNTATVCSAPGTGSTTTTRPNVRFTFNTPTLLTWLPVTDLYTDAGATTAYITGTSANTVYTKPVASITYTATATSGAGCTSSNTTAITNVTAVAVATQPISTAMCAGQTASFTASATVPAATYQWRKNSVDISTVTNPSAGTATLILPNITSLDADIYDVVVSACATNATSNSATLTVKPVPTASASGTSPICQTNTLQLTGTTDIGTSYSWTGPDGFTSTSQNPSIASITPLGTGTYSFVASLNGCNSLPGTTSILVNNNPVNLGTTATPASICNGNTSSLASTFFLPVLTTVNNYSFVNGTGAALDPMVGANTVLTVSNDDTPTPAPVSIGFTFTYDSVDYTQYSVSPDGWILLGGAVASSQYTNVITSTLNNPKIYPYWDDAATGIDGNVKTLVTGTAPYRIFKVQWFVTIPRNTIGSANSYFQAWLYETTNIIEFRYGTMGVDPTGLASIGLTGRTPTNFNSITAVTNTNSTSVASDTNTSQPATGTIYTLSPPQISLDYAWTPALSVVTPLSSTTLTNALSTTTNFSVTATNLITGCYATATTTVTVSDPSIGGTATATATTVCSGTGTTIALSGYNGSIQWQSSLDGSTWANISGETAPTLLTGNLTAPMNHYQAVVTSGGCAPAISSMVMISVDPVSIGGHIAGSDTVCAGTNSIPLTLSGNTGNVLKWQSSVNGTTWSDISNTTTSYTATNLTASTYYRAEVQSGICSSAYSDTALVTVNPIPTASIINNPAVCVGDSILLTVNLTGTAPWDIIVTNGVDGNFPITGLSTSPWTSWEHPIPAHVYSVLSVTDANGCVNTNVVTAVMAINPRPVPVITGASPVCAVSAGLTYSTQPGMTNYIWNVSAGGTITAGAGTNQITVSWNSTAAQNVSVSYTNTNGCTTETPTIFNVSVDPVNVGGTISGTATVCAGTNSTLLTLNGNIGNVLRWEASTNGGSSWTTIANTSTTYTATNLTITTQYRAVIQSGVCDPAISSVVIVTVDPVTVAGSVSGGATVCSGTNSTLLTLNGNTGSVVRWESSPDGTTWTPITSTSTTYTATNLTATTQFRAVVQSGVCSIENSAAATVTVDPISIGGTLSSDTVFCSTTNSRLLSLAGSSGNIIRWENSTDGGTTWNPISNTVNTYTANNVAVTTKFRAVTQSGVCPITYSTVVTITINTPPTVTITSFTNPSVCAAANGTATVNSATSYSWNTIPVQTTQTATGLAAGTYYVTISDGVCSNSTSVTLSDPSAPTVTIGSTATLTCAGAPVTFTGNGATTYEFFVNGVSQGAATTTNTLTTTTLANGNVVTVRGVTAGCTGNSTGITITVDPVSNGGVLSGAATVCSSGNSTLLTLNSFVGIIQKWQSSPDGNTWSDISNTTNTYTATNLTATTHYRAVVQSGICSSANSTVAIVTVTPMPTASISYAGTPYCSTLTTGQAVSLTGTTGGTYSAAAGLSLNATTGAVTPSTSSAGTYTVTYTITAAGGCAVVTATSAVTVTTVPTATISYAGTPYCNSISTAEAVTQTGTTGGTYSAAAGLSINATTGAITPGTSTAGTYTVTYTIPAGSGCAAVPVTTSVTITTLPTAAISYTATPFCSTVTTPQAVTLTGTTGGTYSAAAGLSINAATGAITPNTSTAGTYTVTYTIAAASGCAAVTATTAATVTALPTATISYTGTPFCKTVTTAQAVTQTGTTGGTYSAAAGLSINATTGAITPSTSTAGNYTVTYTIAAADGCAVVTATTAVTITTAPAATISYAGTPFCSNNATVQAVTLTGTTGGTFSAPAGLSINATTGAITASTSTAATYTVTYTIAAASGCAAVTATTAVTVTALPTATISYAGTPFCKTVTTAQAVSQTGTTGGTYSAAAGLSINATTGAITPSTSTAGTYTVTYTIAAAGGCAVVTATTAVTITTAPTATISYAGTPYCKTVTTAQAVTQTGTTGGTYSAAAGLSINASTGAITPSTSTAGTYTVTYTIAASGGCAVVTATTAVTITTAPTATISYAGSPFCSTVTTAQAVTQTGTTGGTYSAAAGLSINATTGAITPSTSTAGTYTVTYTIAASGGCAVVTATTSVTVNTAPTATITYAATPYCTSVTTAQAVTQTGTTGGTYSAAAGLSINATTGAVTPSTSTAGTYTVTYTIAASGGCAVVTATTAVTITAAPTAAISYAGTPFCSSNATAQAVTLTGTAGGTYSAAAGLSINASTGAITPSTSTIGTYTVTYSIAAAGGCAAISTSTSVSINIAPTATIVYAGTPYCTTVTSAQAVTLTGGSGGTYSAAAGLSLNATTGAVTPSTSTAGTYTVTYTIPPSGGCGVLIVTTSVTITAAPSATIAYAGSPFCKTVTTAQAVTLTGTTGGTYSAAAGLSINATTGAITPSTSTAGNYTVTYTMAAAGGCTTVTTTTSVTITAAPTATITYAGSPYCNNVTTAQAVTLTGTAGGAYTVAPAGLTINATTGAIIPSTSTAGVYTVTYTIAAFGGCSSISASTPVAVAPIPGPAGAITSVNNDSVVAGEINVAYTVPVIANATSYKWYYSGTGITYTPTTATNNLIINFGPTATSGILTVYGSNACGYGTVSANYPIYVAVGINDITNNLVYQIYPNPTKGVITINIMGMNSDMDLEIINMQGKVIRSEKLINNNQTFTQDIDLSMYSKGIYFVKFINKNFSKVEKIVLQ